MLNDENALNGINPYADPERFTPGVRYNGGPYNPKLPYGNQKKEEPAQWQDVPPSIGCELTKSAGTGTASYCTPKTTTCNLDRPLLPERLIEQGRWSLPPPESPYVVEEGVLVEGDTVRQEHSDMLLLAVLVILVYLFARK